MRPTVSLRTRLIGFLCLGGLLPVLALALFLLFFVRAELRAGLTRDLDISSDFIAARISREMLITLKVLRDLVRDPLLESDPERILQTTLRQSAVGTTGTSHRSLLVALELRRPDGSVRARWPPRPPARVLEALETGLVNRSGNATSARLATAADREAFAADSQPPLLVISFVRPDAPGRREETLRAVLDLAALSDLIARENPPGGLDKEILVYERAGRVLARLDPTRGLLSPVLGRYAFLGTARGIGRGRISEPRRERDAVFAVKPVLGSGFPAPLDALDWRLASIQPLDDPSESHVALLASIQQGVLAAAAVALVGALALAWILLRTILVPLGHLDQGAKRVAGGDLETPIPVVRADELGALAAAFNEMTGKLRESTRRLIALSATDALTGLANRRVYEERLEHELKRAARYRHSLALAVLDIDHFKRFNDTYGHSFGDVVLCEVARIARSLCRDTDFIARYGGEEFVFVLPETTRENAAMLMERVRTAVAGARIADEAAGIAVSVTVSVGVAAFPANKDSAANLFALADFALYRAKKAGRNQVLASDDL